MNPTPNNGASRGALQTLFRRLHFYIGLFVGPFIFVAAFSGALYVLTPQLENALYADALYIQPAAEPLPLAQQVAAARRHIGEDAVIYALRPAPTPSETTRVQFSEPELGASQSRAIFVSPYTFEIKGDMTVYGTSGVLPLRTWIDLFHRELLLGDAGRIYSELAASWMWVAALGGVALWWMTRPRHKTKRRPQGTARLRYWHLAIGAILLPGLIFFSATGLTWSQWAGGNIDVLRTNMGWMTPQLKTSLGPRADIPPPHPHAEHHATMAVRTMPAAGNDWDRILLTAQNAGLKSHKLEIRPPRAADKGWTVTEIDRSWPTRVDAVAIDPHDFSVIDKTSFDDFPLLARLTRWGIDAHMGVLFGVANQLLLAVFGFGLCAMIVLGYRMWWLKRPHSPVANPARTLSAAWRQLSLAWQMVLLSIALLLGYALPVMGASLLLFIALDLLRWRRQRRRASTPA